MWINTAEYSRDAQFFKKNGYYCSAPKGTRDYKDYWDEQIDRCINGYSIGGQRITGHHYGYLNFAQIKLIDDAEGKHIDKTIKGISGKKIVSFPSFWDGDAEYFRTLELAQSKGQHLCVAKARRKGYSFKNGWVAANTYNTVKNSMVILGAHEKKFLFGGAGITKMTKDYLEFLNEHTAWTKRRQISNKIEELRASYIKYINGVPIESGYKSTILSVSFKDNFDAARGKDSQLVFFDECFGKDTKILMSDNTFKNIQNITINDYILGIDGKPKKVLRTATNNGELYKIKQKNGIDYIVNGEHRLYLKHGNYINDKKVLDISVKEYIEKCKNNKSFNKITYQCKTKIIGENKLLSIDPYVFGLWLGDGSKDRFRIVGHIDDINIGNTIKNIYPESNIIFENNYYRINNKHLKENLRDLNVLNNKHIPKEYLFSSLEQRKSLLAGLIDTDGWLQKNTLYITQKSETLAKDICFLARSIGLRASIHIKRNKKYGNYYTCNMYGDIKDLPLQLDRKKATRINKEDIDITNFDIEYIGKGDYYGITVEDNLLIGEDLTILRNCGKWPHLLSAVKATLETLKDGIYTTGIMVVFGTGGEDNDDWADFNELFYNPEPYGFLALDNVWDEDLVGTKSGFFVPSYLNKVGFMDADGNSDIVGAKKWETEKRDMISLTAKSRSALDSYITENPWCPKEAFQVTKGKIFPTAELQRHLAYLETNKEANYLGNKGELHFDEDGKIKFTLNESLRAADYPTKKNEEEGCITIWEHPPKDGVPYGLYIAGCDPYDHDRSETGSLGSVFIFKQVNHMGETYDWPVAEYTGRPDRASMFYENVRKLLLYYNAIGLYENQVKGLHQYFQTKNCDYLLKDQPLIIKDIIKDSKVQREKGIHMNLIIKDYCERVTRDWLLEEYAPGKLNLTKIYSKPLLKELIAYNDEGNFDRGIAFMLCILHRLENHKIKVSKAKESDFIDDFFTRDLFV